MATQKLAAGGVSSWTNLFNSSDINSLASGSSVLSSIQIDNTGALDLMLDVSFNLGAVTVGAGAPSLSLFLAILNEDGSTYGDGLFASQAAGSPSSAYLVRAWTFVASNAYSPLVGSATGIVLPRQKFKCYLLNSLGATLNSSGNVIDYQTTNYTVA